MNRRGNYYIQIVDPTGGSTNTFPLGTLVRITYDDGSNCPYFVTRANKSRRCEFIRSMEEVPEELVTKAQKILLRPL